MTFPESLHGGVTSADMDTLIKRIRTHIDHQQLDKLIKRLRELDVALDQKMEDIRASQQDVSVWDRINVFTISDAEHTLSEENKNFRAIRTEHAQVVESIKALIREAIPKDYQVSFKAQMAGIMKTASALRIQHRWGVVGKPHGYEITGLKELHERIAQHAARINQQYDLPPEPMDTEDMLNVVYDDILREHGFVE